MPLCESFSTQVVLKGGEVTWHGDAWVRKHMGLMPTLVLHHPYTQIWVAADHIQHAQCSMPLAACGGSLLCGTCYSWQGRVFLGYSPYTLLWV